MTVGYKSILGRRLGLTPYGLVVDGRPVGDPVLGDRQFFYVDSTVDGGSGETPETALGTIDEAIERCVADRHDVVVVMPGHTETFTATGLTVDVDGVTIIAAVDFGDMQPRIHFNHASAEISVSADNVTIAGLRLSADITSVAVGIEIEDGATDCRIIGNLFDVVADGTDEFVVAIRTNDASNRALIEGNTIDMGIGGAVSAISFTKDTDRTVVRGNKVWGDYSTACINGLTTLSTKLLIEDNLLVNGIGGDINTEPAIELVTGTTGIIRRNDIVCNLATKAASIVADTALLFENYYNEDISGAATGGIIGAASADD